MQRCMKSRQLQVVFTRGSVAESNSLIPLYHKILIYDNSFFFFGQGSTKSTSVNTQVGIDSFFKFSVSRSPICLKKNPICCGFTLLNRPHMLPIFSWYVAKIPPPPSHMFLVCCKMPPPPPPPPICYPYVLAAVNLVWTALQTTNAEVVATCTLTRLMFIKH